MQVKHKGASVYDPGYIYIVRTGNNVNEIKIGLTRNLPQRERGLFNTSVALPFVPMALWRVPSMRPAEFAAHEVMYAHRVSERREFFEVLPRLHSSSEERDDEDLSDIYISQISEWIEEGFYMAGIQYERVYL